MSNFGNDPLKDPELQGTEIDFKLTLYRHLDRIGRVSCSINPYIKGDLYEFDGAVETLKAFLSPYLTEEFKEKIASLEDEKSKLQIDYSRDDRMLYKLIILKKLSYLTDVMDKWGMLLKRFENLDIDVIGED